MHKRVILAKSIYFYEVRLCLVHKPKKDVMIQHCFLENKTLVTILSNL